MPRLAEVRLRLRPISLRRDGIPKRLRRKTNQRQGDWIPLAILNRLAGGALSASPQKSAKVAELAYALDLGSSPSHGLGVRLPPFAKGGSVPLQFAA